MAQRVAVSEGLLERNVVRGVKRPRQATRVGRDQHWQPAQLRASVRHADSDSPRRGVAAHRERTDPPACWGSGGPTSTRRPESWLSRRGVSSCSTRPSASTSTSPRAHSTAAGFRSKPCGTLHERPAFSEGPAGAGPAAVRCRVRRHGIRRRGPARATRAPRLVQRRLPAAVSRHGLPEVRLHSVRHSLAFWLPMRGSPADAAALLGHAVRQRQRSDGSRVIAAVVDLVRL